VPAAGFVTPVEEADEIPLPAREEGSGRPHVGRRDRSIPRAPCLVGRAELAEWCHVEQRPALRIVGREQHPERRALASRTAQLDEREVVAVGQDADPLARDGAPADGAADTIEEWAELVARIHARCSLAERASDWLSRIPPGGMIPANGAAGAHHPRDDLPMGSTEARRASATPAPDHFRHSYSKDRSQLIRRLSRMEGQVRGIARMIEREEYCIDILQQTSALRAAVDSLSIMLLEDHVQGCVRTAAARGEADQYVDEVIDVVRRTLGRPVRSTARSA
jgi:CsoR family transcriptional regulator, copper-sensing transcriptional repressor